MQRVAHRLLLVLASAGFVGGNPAFCISSPGSLYPDNTDPKYNARRFSKTAGAGTRRAVTASSA
jgi:hypothetical protein